MVCLLQPRVLDEWHHMDHAHMNRHLPALAGRTIRLKLGEHKRQRSGVSTRGICRGSSEDHRARTRQQLVSETAKPQDGRSSNDPTSVLRSQRTATGIPPDLWSIDSTLSRSSPYSRSCIMGCLCSRLYASSRMLKMSASFVLASLRGSTYGTEYDSPLRSLRPRWTTILSILRAVLALARFVKSQRGLSGN